MLDRCRNLVFTGPAGVIAPGTAESDHNYGEFGRPAFSSRVIFDGVASTFRSMAWSRDITGMAKAMTALAVIAEKSDYYLLYFLKSKGANSLR